MEKDSETNKSETTFEPSIEDVKKCIDTLNYFLSDGIRLSEISKDQRIDLMTAAGRLSRPAKTEVSQRNKLLNRAKKRKLALEDRDTRAQAGIREARLKKVFEAPKRVFLSDGEPQQERTLNSAQNCYVCKQEYTSIHHFYDSMCPSCGDFNYAKRFQTASLHGQVAVITGSRLKIGYHCTLMMLRSGARVIATTRFPHDSALRFSKEEDYNDWKDRLQIYGLDLRHTPSVELFCMHLDRTLDRLDILINNAAQTVRRPPGFMLT